MSRLSDVAAIATLVGGHLLVPPFDNLLTHISPTPPNNVIYMLGYAGSTSATAKRYVELIGVALIDVGKSANSHVPHWRGAVRAA